MKVDGNKRLSLFVEFVNAIKISAGCSHQLAHARHDQSPYWLEIRDKLEAVIDISSKLPIYDEKQAYVWTQVAGSIKGLAEGVRQLYKSKALSMDVVNKMLDHRLENADRSNT